ncbi:reverse transcriptase protein [Rutstroemia sp. NJR-2017a BBW]|nr:reverse transcriptase protein [Rutstroemia sp. NJR-2017a BBW]
MGEAISTDDRDTIIALSNVLISYWLYDNINLLGKNRLKLHKGLSKAGSAILIQSRAGRTSCAHFLHTRGVPGFESPVCRHCYNGTETVEHILLHCGAERARRQWRGGTTITELLDSPDRAQQVAKWLIQSGRFEHFRLANPLQYEK